MGEQKWRQQSDRSILETHKFCCYCGAPSKEPDHIPPRCFFDRNVAPHGYVFPSCVACNRLTSQDEQALGVVLPMNFRETESADATRTHRLMRGVVNNQLDLAREWTSDSGAVARKRAFREQFGPAGDALRHAGFGMATIGPLTWQAIDRFALKLGHAFFFKYIEQRLIGAVEYCLISTLEANNEAVSTALRIAPEIPRIGRNGRSLTNRFDYRFNHSPDLGVIWIVAYFGGQFALSIMAAETSFFQQMEAQDSKRPDSPYWRRITSEYFDPSGPKVLPAPPGG